MEGYPQNTFTADHGHADVEHVAPSAPYLAMLAGGLQQAHGWSLHDAASYLAALPGIGSWNARTIVAEVSRTEQR